MRLRQERPGLAVLRIEFDGSFEQWNRAAFAFLSVKPRLVAPGATSPRSAEPSSSMMWCVAASLFLKMTVSPVAAITGLGL